jgi:hypothetical protein
MELAVAVLKTHTTFNYGLSVPFSQVINETLVSEE